MSWQAAIAYAITKATINHVAAIVIANKEIVDANHPGNVKRIVDGNPNATDDAIKLVSKVTFQYLYMQEVVAFALQNLKDKSPVGSKHDEHPGLYRDSHLVFLNGVITTDVSGWQPGQVVHLSNPEPYSRKIESGRFHYNLPGHVYEDTAQIVAEKYGQSISVRFVYMPINLGNTQAGKDVKPSWLSRQPAIELRAL